VRGSPEAQAGSPEEPGTVQQTVALVGRWARCVALWLGGGALPTARDWSNFASGGRLRNPDAAGLQY